MDPGGVINIVSKRPQLTPYHAITLTGSSYAHGRDGAHAAVAACQATGYNVIGATGVAGAPGGNLDAQCADTVLEENAALFK